MKKVLFVAMIMGFVWQCECVQDEINEDNIYKTDWNFVNPKPAHIHVVAKMVEKGSLNPRHELVQGLIERILSEIKNWYLSKEEALLVNELLNTSLLFGDNKSLDIPELLGNWEFQMLSMLREKRDAGNFYAATIYPSRIRDRKMRKN
ncbi:MAG: hypothetical protein LBJ96_03365 [Holosporaceae bacterium]|nr:hypothetical protein [Holosporaceae bacterium]